MNPLISSKMLKILSKKSNFQLFHPARKIIVRCLSTEAAVKPKTESQIKDIKFTLKPRRARTLKPFKTHLIENLFAGEFDCDALEFPEIMDDEELDTVLQYSSAIEKIMNSELNSHEIDVSGKIPDSVLKRLKDLKLFLLTVPRKYGGLEFTETECTFLQEVLGCDPSVSQTVAETSGLGVAILNRFGTEDQKKIYYPRLVNGELLSFAYLEEGPLVDINSFNTTTATYDCDNKRYLLNGKKTWVYNAKMADMFLVMATSTVTQELSSSVGSVLLLVDKKEKGITVHEKYDNTGVRGLEACDVTFDNVSVPIEQSIGSNLDGYNYFRKVAALGRISHGAQCCALLKRLVFNATMFCEGNKLKGRKLKDWDHIQGRLGNLTRMTYAVESIVYYLAGRSDAFIDPDLFLESFIVKIYCSETLQQALQEYLQIVGPMQFLKGSYIDRYIRDCQFYALCDETNLNLKLAIASLSLVHAGQVLQGKINVIRNPFNFPKLALKYAFVNNDYGDMPNLTGYIALNLPNHIRSAGEDLEYCIERLRFSVEHLFRDKASEVLERNHEVIELTDMVIQIYSIIASCSRAWNSLKFDLPSAEEECLLAESVANRAKLKVKSNALLLTQYSNEVLLQKQLGGRSFRERQYPCAHPLTRNW